MKELPKFIMLGLALLITSIVFYLFYTPLEPTLYNKQKIWDGVPIFPIVLALVFLEC